MDSRAQACQAFIRDSLRMLARARERIAETMKSGHPTREGIWELFRTVHTIKGTATMIPGAEEIVAALHGLEDQLADDRGMRLAPEDFQKMTITLARVAELLDQLAKKRVFEIRQVKDVSQGTGPDFGMLGKLKIRGKRVTAWFPLKNVTRVLQNPDTAGLDVVMLDNVWMPVLGRGRQGLVIHSELGDAVVLVDEILGIVAEQDAAAVHALLGLELLRNPSALQTKKAA